MALGPFSTSYDRAKVVDFSKDITRDSFGIFLPRPRLEKDLSSFTKPLSWQVINQILFRNVYVFRKIICNTTIFRKIQLSVSFNTAIIAFYSKFRSYHS